MKFKTKYTFKNDVYSKGSTHCQILDNQTKKTEDLIGYEPKYSVKYDKNGVRNLVVDGYSNIYKKIQSFKNDTDIYKILDKYFNGDISVLDKNKGFYADVTKIPKNFNDFHNKIAEGQEIYNGLPTDLKARFGNNINTFMNSIYNKEFEKQYNDYLIEKGKIVNHNLNNDIIEQVNSDVKSEVKSDEK